MKLKHSLLVASLAAAVCLSADNVLGQDGGGRRQGGGGGFGCAGGGGFGGGRGGNFDPTEFQRMRMERLREAMEVTDDAEWRVIEERIAKVNDANTAVMAANMPGFGRGRGGRGGGRGAGGAGGGAFGQPMPELEALRNAIETNAPEAQVKAALQRYRDARKAREDALAKAQAELQKVLTPKQEAIAVTEGLLK